MQKNQKDFLTRLNFYSKLFFYKKYSKKILSFPQIDL